MQADGLKGKELLADPQALWVAAMPGRGASHPLVFALSFGRIKQTRLDAVTVDRGQVTQVVTGRGLGPGQHDDDHQCPHREPGRTGDDHDCGRRHPRGSRIRLGGRWSVLATDRG